MIVPSDVTPARSPAMKPVRDGTPREGTRKSRLPRLIEDLTRSLSPSFSDLVPLATSIAKEFQDSKFNLLVVGQFNPAKFTLVDALVGDQILPTAVVPLTSIVTISRYGFEERITVSFAGGTSEIIARKSLPDFVN